MGAFRRYIFVSVIQVPDAALESEVANIIATAKRNNVAHDISGALVRSDGRFTQVFEGPPESVERLVALMESDPRHAELRVIEDAPRRARTFPVGLLYADITDIVVGFIHRLHSSGPASGDIARLLSLVKRHAR